jgi:ACT domain-containing protein
LKLTGDGTVRLVSCPDGRVMGGMGAVGFIQHINNTDLQAFIDQIKAKRAELEVSVAAPQPDNPRSNLYTFTKI